MDIFFLHQDIEEVPRPLLGAGLGRDGEASGGSWVLVRDPWRTSPSYIRPSGCELL